MIEFAIRRPVSVFVICLGIFVLGIISYQRIPVQLMPQMDVPEFKITTLWQNSTPEDVETQITTPIERAVSTISGLKNSSAISEVGSSQVILKFKSNIDIPATLAELRDKVDGIGLPEGVRKPKITRFQSASSYISEFLVRPKSTNQSLLETGLLLKETLVRQLERIDGVALVQILGQPTEELSITVDPTALQVYGLTLQSIADSIQNQNKVVQVGQIEHLGRKIPVRLGKLLSNKEELLNISIKKDGEKALRLADIASVEVVRVTEDHTSWNSSPGLLVQVRKEAEANSVEVGDSVRASVKDYFEENSAELDYLSLVDQGAEISAAVDNVKSSVISGAILAALIIYLLLQSGWTSFVITVAIPISLLMSLIMMYFSGVSFNLMSLAGLALGVGMLVDNSTIVLESISLQQLITEDRFEAALFGTKKVFAAILSSTLSTIAVFAPLVFIEGEIGFLFRDVAWTICYSILASLIVAVIVIPCLSTRKNHKITEDGQRSKSLPLNLRSVGDWSLNLKIYARKISSLYLDSISNIILTITTLAKHFFMRALSPIGGKASQVRDFVFNVVQLVFHRFERWIDKVVPFWVERITLTSLLIVGSVFLGSLLIATRGSELFPEEKVDRVQFSLLFPPSTVKENNEKVLHDIETSIQTLKDVKNVVIRRGLGSKYSLTVLSKAGSVDQAIDAVAKKLQVVPDLKFDRKKITVFDDQKPIQILVTLDNLQQLKLEADQIQSRVSQLNGLIDIEGSLERWVPQIQLEVENQKLTYLGLDPGGLVAVTRNLLEKISLPPLQFGEKSISGLITQKRRLIQSPEDLSHISVNGEASRKIYMGHISKTKFGNVPSVLLREDRQRVSLVQANLNDLDLESAIQKIEVALKGLKNWRFGGQRQQQQESQRNLLIALALSVLLIYLITASQFESLLQPLVVLIAIPLSVLGVGFFLILFGLNFSALVMVGFIILVGASVNTSIVMVDFANQLMREGKDAKTAILMSTKKRMRPIVVTTAANILGLVPMAMSFGQPGSSMQQPLSVTLIGGLVTSTVLTMLAVPAFYVWIRGGMRDIKENA
ncbi:MAG: efflux RND transporter permease subunit [Bdellovibrionales bacterium]|nr:efflux RND transporter permease subunit [Bdellovibrionales bacterium]